MYFIKKTIYDAFNWLEKESVRPCIAGVKSLTTTHGVTVLDGASHMSASLVKVAAATDDLLDPSEPKKLGHIKNKENTKLAFDLYKK